MVPVMCGQAGGSPLPAARLRNGRGLSAGAVPAGTFSVVRSLFRAEPVEFGRAQRGEDPGDGEGLGRCAPRQRGGVQGQAMEVLADRTKRAAAHHGVGGAPGQRVEGTGEELLLQVLDAGAEDAVEEDGELIVYTESEALRIFPLYPLAEHNRRLNEPSERPCQVLAPRCVR